MTISSSDVHTQYITSLQKSFYYGNLMYLSNLVRFFTLIREADRGFAKARASGCSRRDGAALRSTLPDQFELVTIPAHHPSVSQE